MDFLRKYFSPKRIYLDYAAATPVLPEVLAEMRKYEREAFYNPNAIYEEGLAVKRAVDEYRTRIARILGVAKENIIFTSGGTEANTIAVRGATAGGGRVALGEGTHPSVHDAIRPSDKEEIVLVSSVVADNKLGRKIREERKKNLPAGRQGNSIYPLLHVDASQTAQYVAVGLETLACDLLTLDAAKIYGPKGIGALVVRSGVNLDIPPRGTPPVALIAGFAKAFEIVSRDREKERARVEALAQEFAREVTRLLPQAIVSHLGVNIVTVSVPGILPELLVLALERGGVLASAGPACEAQKPEPAETPVRFSLGRTTTRKELCKAAEVLCDVVQNMIK